MTEEFDSLQALIDAEDDPVFVLDVDLRYTAFNRTHAGAMRALYGAEIALGGRLTDYQTVTADREFASANVERALAGERVVARALSGEQGHERCFEVVHTPLVDAAGKVVGVGVRASDVTEHVREEAERDLLSDVIEASLNEIYIFSQETLRFLFVNEGARRNLGYSSTELAEMTPLDVKPEISPDAFTELVQPLIRHEKPRLVFHTVHQRADGSRYPAEVHLQLFDQRPDPVYLAVIQDITERSTAEAPLRDSERRWREILVHTPQIGVTLDREGRIVFANRRFLELTGWGEAEVLGRDWFELCIPEQVRAEVRDVFDTTIARNDVGGFSSYENAILTRSGELRDMAWSNAVSTDEHGAIVEVTSLGVDITERKRAETELQVSRRGLIEAERIAGLGSWTYDPATQQPEWSEGMFRIWGLEPRFGAPPYSEHSKLIHPEDFPRFDAAVREAVEHGTPYVMDLRIRRPDGGERTITTIGEALRDPTGTVTSLRGTTQDITERKQAEEALRESEARLSDSFNLAPLAYQSLDEQGRFLEVNPAWLEALGYRREEVIGRWFGDFLAPEYVEPFRKRFPLFKERGSIHSEFEMMHKGGERHVTAFEGRIGHWPDGTFKQTHCILTDITERKRAEDALRESESLLREVADNYPNSYVSIIERDLTIGFTSGREFKKRGLDPQQFVGLSLEQVFGEDAPIARDNYLMAFGGAEVEFELFTNDQHQLYRAVPLKRRDGKVERVLAVVENITERKRAEEEIRRLNAELERRVVSRTAQLEAAQHGAGGLRLLGLARPARPAARHQRLQHSAHGGRRRTAHGDRPRSPRAGARRLATHGAADRRAARSLEGCAAGDAPRGCRPQRPGGRAARRARRGRAGAPSRDRGRPGPARSRRRGARACHPRQPARQRLEVHRQARGGAHRGRRPRRRRRARLLRARRRRRL